MILMMFNFYCTNTVFLSSIYPSYYSLQQTEYSDLRKAGRPVNIKDAVARTNQAIK